MIASFSFASTAHVTQRSNYLTQRAEILTRRSCPWFLAELDHCSKSINISTCIHRHPGMPGYKKHNRLRMSSILHPTIPASFHWDTAIWKCQNLQRNVWQAERCPTRRPDAIHFFVNFEVFKSLYLSENKSDWHQTYRNLVNLGKLFLTMWINSC